MSLRKGQRQRLCGVNRRHATGGQRIDILLILLGVLLIIRRIHRANGQVFQKLVRAADMIFVHVRQQQEIQRVDALVRQSGENVVCGIVESCVDHGGVSVAFQQDAVALAYVKEGDGERGQPLRAAGKHCKHQAERQEQ